MEGQNDLAGRLVIGFEVGSRERVDAIYAEMTAAGYRGLQPPMMRFGVRDMLSSKTRTGSQSDS
jgi:hypothetical protein